MSANENKYVNGWVSLLVVLGTVGCVIGICIYQDGAVADSMTTARDDPHLDLKRQKAAKYVIDRMLH